MFTYVQESGLTTTSMMSKIMKNEIPIKSRSGIHQNSSFFFFFILFDVLDWFSPNGFRFKIREFFHEEKVSWEFLGRIHEEESNRVKNTCGARIFFEILPSEFPKNEQLTFSEELKNTGLIRQSVHEWRNRSTSEETLQNISLRVKKPVYEWRNRSSSEETISFGGFLNS